MEYMVKILWVTLKTHRIMDGFVKNGLKYDPTISVSFIRFPLVKQTGSNVLAEIGLKLSASDEKNAKEIKKAAMLAGSAYAASKNGEKMAIRVINKMDDICRGKTLLARPS